MHSQSMYLHWEIHARSPLLAVALRVDLIVVCSKSIDSVLQSKHALLHIYKNLLAYFFGK